MSVTQSQIASAIGVSQRTVSEAFRPDGRISAPTRQRILDHARRLGYLPNAAARAARTGRFNAVAFLRGTAKGTDWFPATLIEGIERALEEGGLRLIMARVKESRLGDEDYLPQVLREHAIDGLIINYLFRIPDALRKMIDHYRVPAVWVNSAVDSDCVLPDDVHAGATMTEHLLDLGHRRIAFAWFPSLPFPDYYHPSGPDRQAGYTKTMQAAGLDPLVMSVDGSASQVDRVAQAQAWLLAHPQVTAVATYARHEANDLIQACLRLGRRVPEELSIVTIEAAGAWLTHYDLPEKEMGRQAVELLTRRIEAPDDRNPPIRVRGTLVQGLSDRRLAPT